MYGEKYFYDLSTGKAFFSGRSDLSDRTCTQGLKSLGRPDWSSSNVLFLCHGLHCSSHCFLLKGWILFPVFSFVVIVLSIEGYPTSVWNWCKKTVTKTEAEKSTKPFSSAALKFCLWPWSGQCRSYSKFYCNLEHKNLQTEAVWSIKFSFRN